MWNMMHWIAENGKPDFAINSGIAGSFTDLVSTGEVVIAVNECFADLGIEDKDSFHTLAEAGLEGAEDYPFVNGWIAADKKIISRFNYLKPVKSITVNTATGSDTTIGRLVEKFKPDIETMEGASFFYLCRREAIPFMAVRSISNRIEPRNKAGWNIKLALDNLAASLYDVFLTLDSVK
jgi:futalosine hydrolase